ncbi:SDR family oxidoreductase [Nonomuraea fastidiosa]
MQATGSSIAYGAGKAALIHRTRDPAIALGPKVRVNAVAPGIVATRWHIDRVGEQAFFEMAATQELKAPLRRTARPEHIAQMVTALLEPGMVTGAAGAGHADGRGAGRRGAGRRRRPPPRLLTRPQASRKARGSPARRFTTGGRPGGGPRMAGLGWRVSDGGSRAAGLGWRVSGGGRPGGGSRVAGVRQRASDWRASGWQAPGSDPGAGPSPLPAPGAPPRAPRPRIGGRAGQLRAAVTSERASSCTLARWSGPLKDSA